MPDILNTSTLTQDYFDFIVSGHSDHPKEIQFCLHLLQELVNKETQTGFWEESAIDFKIEPLAETLGSDSYVDAGVCITVNALGVELDLSMFIRKFQTIDRHSPASHDLQIAFFVYPPEGDQAIAEFRCLALDHWDSNKIATNIAKELAAQFTH